MRFKRQSLDSFYLPNSYPQLIHIIRYINNIFDFELPV